MKHIFISALILSGSAFSLNGQAILDQYVKEAVEQNLTIEQRQAIERKQQYALEHAG